MSKSGISSPEPIFAISVRISRTTAARWALNANAADLKLAAEQCVHYLRRRLAFGDVHLKGSRPQRANAVRINMRYPCFADGFRGSLELASYAECLSV
ncbi:MAG: hypothetical protein IPM21_02895 [Acidobacteria bacterium]|nr:hypothetical protein [Acidobacteriota bacterium]